MTSARSTAPSVARGPGRPAAGTVTLGNGELLDRALETFAELGYEGTSIRELCRRLGVSHNFVHQRFGSKDRLWYAAMDHGFRHLAGEFGDAVVGAVDELDGLRRVMVRFLEVTAAKPALVGVINQESLIDGPRLSHLVDRYLAPAVLLMDLAVDHLVSEGRLRPLPAPMLYVLVAHGAGGVITMRGLADRLGLAPMEPGSRELSDFANLVVDVILRGMEPDRRRVPADDAYQRRP